MRVSFIGLLADHRKKLILAVISFDTESTTALTAHTHSRSYSSSVAAISTWYQLLFTIYLLPSCYLQHVNYPIGHVLSLAYNTYRISNIAAYMLYVKVAYRNTCFTCIYTLLRRRALKWVRVDTPSSFFATSKVLQFM